MSRRHSLRETCNKLGLLDKLSINDDIDNIDQDSNEYIEVENVKDDREKLLLQLMLEISKLLKREMIILPIKMMVIVRIIMTEPQVIKNIILLTAYRAEAAFLIHPRESCSKTTPKCPSTVEKAINCGEVTPKFFQFTNHYFSSNV